MKIFVIIFIALMSISIIMVAASVIGTAKADKRRRKRVQQAEEIIYHILNSKTEAISSEH